MPRNLVVKRNTAVKDQPLMLCDGNTGEFLPGQLKLEIMQEPGDIAKVVVTFVTQRKSGTLNIPGVKIQVDD